MKTTCLYCHLTYDTDGEYIHQCTDGGKAMRESFERGLGGMTFHGAPILEKQYVPLAGPDVPFVGSAAYYRPNKKARTRLKIRVESQAGSEWMKPNEVAAGTIVMVNAPDLADSTYGIVLPPPPIAVGVPVLVFDGGGLYGLRYDIQRVMPMPIGTRVIFTQEAER